MNGWWVNEGPGSSECLGVVVAGGGGCVLAAEGGGVGLKDRGTFDRVGCCVRHVVFWSEHCVVWVIHCVMCDVMSARGLVMSEGAL